MVTKGMGKSWHEDLEIGGDGEGVMRENPQIGKYNQLEKETTTK